MNFCPIFKGIFGLHGLAMCVTIYQSFFTLCLTDFRILYVCDLKHLNYYDQFKDGKIHNNTFLYGTNLK